jgi:hypothetical protein
MTAVGGAPWTALGIGKAGGLFPLAMSLKELSMPGHNLFPRLLPIGESEGIDSVVVVSRDWLSNAC